MRLPFPLVFAFSLVACGSVETTSPTSMNDAGTDAPIIVPPPPDGGSHVPGGKFCDLPGSFQTTKDGVVKVPGGASSVDLSFMRLPEGFCVHHFADVGNPRQIRFAPGGELFVASPTTGTTSGGQKGQAAILVLPDDNGDGLADSSIKFLTGLASTQGLLFTRDNAHFYYQDETRIMRMPYKPGDRKPSGGSELVADIQIYYSPLHWPKVLDEADDGTIYVGNGGDQGESCVSSHPFHGGILKLDGSPGGKEVARGLRNPIGIRCTRGHQACYAIELARDYSANQGGREKLIPIRDGDDWGFPCCATKDVPYPDIAPVPNCAGVAPETDAFTIGSTPFDLDFEQGKWPEPWKGRVYVPLHGAAGTWEGARLVAIATDPTTGLPLSGSDLSGSSSGAMADFATGWEDHFHGRPTVVAFAPDGRLFLTNDKDGNIVWIAPLDLK